ncbi:hypothetical protein [uncultured Phycicoccus sp.]|uniref:hypothetical protein n=1 Tax=uncultured Phycicoccus sp. TaxID=661422 RepID=UPI002604A65C|nr:hypothetical protein [uncultured Phycicoccus sp.]
MSTAQVILVVLVVVVLGGALAYFSMNRGSRHEAAERAKAEELREQAAEHDRELREREAAAAEAQAKSDLARAEAEKQQLEAERLAREAADRSAAAGEVRDEREEQLRLADRHDPDVPTDDEGHRRDGHHDAADPAARRDPTA